MEEKKDLLALCPGSGRTKLLQALQRKVRNSAKEVWKGQQAQRWASCPTHHCTYSNLFNSLALKNEAKVVPSWEIPLCTEIHSLEKSCRENSTFPVKKPVFLQN